MPNADYGAGAATHASSLSPQEQTKSLKDDEGIISPLTFPEPSMSVDSVNAMASGLRDLGTSIADTGNDITGSWAGLSAHYSAPEAETLFSVLGPVATDGDTVGEELERAAKALENFAEDVSTIKARWSSLRTEAYDLRSRIKDEGEDWNKVEGFWNRVAGNESPLAVENDALIKKGDKIIESYIEAENTCANAINDGIPDRTRFEEQPEGDAELDPNVFYHGFEQDLSELATEWGRQGAQTDHGWWVDAGHAVWDYGVDAVQGVGAMVGAHSSEGWFQASWGDALKEYHWDNITSAASLVGLYDAESDSLGPAGWDAVGQAWKELAHSVVPWEEWGDRPGYVIGTAALNVLGLVGGAVLTATGVGAAVGVPLMAWRGMSIMDGMGGSGRGGGGSGPGLSLPQIPDIPQFGGPGSPLINLTGKILDATGYGPSQLADLRALINKMLPTSDGAESGSGATRPRPGEGASPADGRAVQRPAQDPTQDPTVGDTLAFDDIVNHPDNQAFGDQVKSDHRGEIDQVDRAAKTGPGSTPASPEGNWTGDAGQGRGPDASGDREPAMAGGGRPNDTMDASAARNTPEPSSTHARADGIDTPGGGRSSGNEVADNRGDHGADMSDRNPTARNQDGGSSGPVKSAPATPARHDLGDLGDRHSGRRSGGETTTGRSDAHSSGPVLHREGTGSGPDHRRDGADRDGVDRDGQSHREDSDAKRTDRDDDSAKDSTSKDADGGSAKPTPAPDTDRGGGEGRTSASEQGSARGKDDDPVSVPKQRDDAQAKAHELLRAMDLGSGKDFADNFLDLVNSKKYGPLMERAFYNVNGDRFRADITVGGQGIPILTRGDSNSPWILRSDLPEPDPPKYHPGSVSGSRIGVELAVLQRLDTIARVRQVTLGVHKVLDDKVRELKKKFEKLKTSVNEADLESAREIRRPVAKGKKIVTEGFGERSAELAVKENFTGQKVAFEEVRKDRMGKPVKDSDGNPIIDRWERDLPNLAESTPENPNPIPTSENAPKNGNDQFDQIWRTEDGGFVIVEAKGSLNTDLGERTVKVGEGEKDLKRVSQGSREYFDDIIKMMESRGGEEKDLALEIKKIMSETPDKLHYAEARGNPGNDGKYEGNSLKLFNLTEVD